MKITAAQVEAAQQAGPGSCAEGLVVQAVEPLLIWCAQQGAPPAALSPWEDTLQHLRVATVLALRSYRSDRGATFTTFLRWCLWSACTHLWRQSKPRGYHGDNDRAWPLVLSLDAPQQGVEDADSCCLADLVVDPSSGNQQLLAELAWLRAEALRRLPPRQFQVVDLCLWHGLSQREAARHLGVSSQTVSQCHRRALRVLRALWEGGE